MPLQASRTIGTGDGWQRTDSGILLPDWADLPKTPPTTTVEIDSEDTARKVLHLLELLDDHDDVQNVYANFDIPDPIFEKVSS